VLEPPLPRHELNIVPSLCLQTSWTGLVVRQGLLLKLPSSGHIAVFASLALFPEVQGLARQDQICPVADAKAQLIESVSVFEGPEGHGSSSQVHVCVKGLHAAFWAAVNVYGQQQPAPYELEVNQQFPKLQFALHSAALS